MNISNENQILAYMHCGLCLDEWHANDAIKNTISPKEYAWTQTGWTSQGLQLWCNRHECNVIHIDFEGKKHPANTSRSPTATLTMNDVADDRRD